MKKLRILILVAFLVPSLSLFQPALAVEPTITEYTSYPIFQLTAVAPNILIMLDNSASMNSQAYWDPYDHTKTYYGYFEPYKSYTYGSGIFVRDASGAWDGNFLNWLTMRRIDIARKVLMGGLATSRTGTGNQTNIGETPTVAGYDFTKYFKDTANWGVTPFDPSLNHTFVVDDGNFYVNGQTFTIKVDKNVVLYPDEAQSFVDGNIAGVLQKIGGKARWGNEFFNYGTGKGESGGRIASTIGTNLTSLITDLQNTPCDTWTPLAEAYYVAMQYFKQEPPAAGLDYSSSDVPCSNVGDDPFYNGTEYVYCAKSFVILLTDGNSTQDQMVPAMFKPYDTATSALGSDVPSFLNYGSHFLDDIALYARTNDLRGDLDGDQNLILYTIYAFGDENAGQNALAETLLKNAARNGGFIDKDGNNYPNRTDEYDLDGDGDPDTYYRAEDGYALESKLLAAVNDILRRAASGTAVSVLAASGEGEANMVQAYYIPNVPSGYEDIKWVGYLQSVWIDSYGNLREDTNGNKALDVTADHIISYYTDPSNGDTRVKKFYVSGVSPFPDTSGDPDETAALNQVSALWEAGSRLALRSPSDRKIFTFIDKDADKTVDENVFNPYDANEEIVSFDSDLASAGVLKPYLGVKDNTAWAYLGASWDTRVTNLINWVRGTEVAGLRSRLLDGHIWKLGDIVHSTPVSVSKPPDNFHVIYGKESYQYFYDEFKNRETVVYVGANDGMLHAFTSWNYDATTHQYSRPTGAPLSEEIGDELWAYIPQSLLPHLKWLPKQDYTHVFYVDLKPKVFDAQILPDNTHYYDPDTYDDWGTFVLVGLNMGGKQISATGDFDYNATTADTTRTFSPSFALLDVTNPREPRLMWEKTYAGLGMTTSVPAIVKVNEKWFAVFGSGPTNYDGSSSQRAHVFVVDLKTGAPYQSGTNDWLFETAEGSAFMNSPVSLDVDLNFSVDAVYFGESYLQGGTWMGKVYKLTVPAVNAAGEYDPYSASIYPDNPKDSTYPWRLWPLFNATRPVTTSVLLSQDGYGNVWIYGGTGRYLSAEDKVNTDTQYIFGVKDPFFNKAHSPTGAFLDNYYHNYGAGLQLQTTDLFNGDTFTILTDGTVFEGETLFGYWKDLLITARAEDGWIRTLTTSKERVLNKPSILAGIVFTPSFVPNDDICGASGESYLYSFHYETGTPFWRPAFSSRTDVISIQGTEMMKVVERLYLGLGKASSLGIHVGLEQGATGFVQQSTGNIITEALNPALFVKSGLRSWQER